MGTEGLQQFRDALWRDSKHALRRLAKDWQFSAGAVVILALGIGANTAVFSILNNTLFQSHPFHQTHRLVNLYQNDAKTAEPEGVSYPALLDLQQETAVFSGVAAAQLREGRYQPLDPQGRPGSARFGLIEYASHNYLEVIGLRPALGRWFTLEEERRSEPVAVLGWTAWSRDFRADPAVLGQTLVVGGVSLQVIGVAPRALSSSVSTALIAALWVPATRAGSESPGQGQPARKLLEQRESLFLQARARLREGVSAQQAQAAMDVTARRFATDHPDSDPKRGITVLPTDSVHVHPREKRLAPVALIGLTVVGLVLAVACSNLATLLLVRSSARRAEISVRLALGATRGQLVRHLLMESLLLSGAGAMAGVALAHAGLRYLATVDLPIVLAMQLDYRVLSYAVVIATLCGVGFGLTPALQATRVDLAGALREEKGSSRGALSLARGWFSLKNGLVTGQVMTSFLLLMGAALAMNIMASTQARSVGFRPDGLAIVETDPGYAGYDLPRARLIFEDLRRQIAALPGVESVFLTKGLPGDGQFDKEFRLEPGNESELLEAEGGWAGPGYFHTMGTPLLFGRTFDERDTPGSPEVIVVSEAFARRYFGMPNAVGKRIYFADAPSKPVEIAGVVGNTRSIDMVVDAPLKAIYRSVAQAGVLPATIVVRTSGNEDALLTLLQQELRRWRPELPVIGALTMKQRQALELSPFRVTAIALGALGGLGLLLAGVGLYAVVAYAVAQRTSELGIRIALGAQPGDLTWLVVRDVTALLGAGIVIGGALSWIAVTLLESSVSQILGVDPWVLAPVAMVILASGAVAAYVPARRAVRTDPIAAIRYR